MLGNYMGILMLNEREDNIKSLTKSRPIAAIPIGGRYRIIDFVLSNMVNSGIHNVGIFTNTKSRSLVDHLGSGKPWDLDRKINGLYVFNHTSERSELRDIDVLNDNMEYIYKSKQDYVIISSSYMLCNMDYNEAAIYHEQSGSDVTVLYKKTETGKSDYLSCSTLYISEENKILSVGKNIGSSDKINISMEMFIMKKSTLIDIVKKSKQTGYHNSIKEVIYEHIMKLNVNAFEFKGYIKRIDSLKNYYTANMDLLNTKVTKELFFSNGLIYTKNKNEASTKYFNGAKVNNALISNGCILKGKIQNSIISRSVTVHEEVEIDNCIIFENCEIKKGCKLTNVIIDRNVIMGENTVLKGSDDFPVVIEKKVEQYQF
ncbi:glucose-1-phosphate adenylyltransferase subunit GlgD [Clostridium estertheticum]|uniref:Glucose-1-phosphate adenylyltransferase subunit GlgD n=1 Tax=Clostridium estertheticum subsp. estertheticum TaxID=1552 RepID=A0A1J0GKZ7_9CLOT|nr:glucose-1-phosphate adenylyltransferase subunit GlgD [Clostridium estertheticum]APC41995.1 glucose-1-phosphate adenylyltransferase subunit GlgD [Clostridium estertheticum subsp. estertheticum]MBU3073150.1 glucose-1-phosphate adenylyltransferase subunit GlgD [Clostridium estertheticum]MBU3163609.1 glucose-1-phosphate adenylyltransferase subunit GlgD [Clostridium estertheticum]MBU3172937.1 glucose-1-phosphate adenylyltransferase subunit GlgD [Clostridium estertheticum]MBZ9616099.1 glucose-1-p